MRAELQVVTSRCLNLLTQVGLAVLQTGFSGAIYTPHTDLVRPGRLRLQISRRLLAAPARQNRLKPR